MRSQMKFLISILLVTVSFAATEAMSQEKKRLSKSGKPQDEAFCAMLGDTRIPDSRCIGEDPKNHTTIVRTIYGVDFSFVIRSTDNQSLCKTIDYVKPLLSYLGNKNIAYKENHFNSNCHYRFVIEKKEDLCSQDGRKIFQNPGVDITLLELTKANNWNQTKTSYLNICK